MTEILSSSDYLQFKKWRLLNSMHKPKSEPSVHKKELLTDIHKEIFSNKIILLLHCYSEKFMMGKYDELAILLTCKKVHKLVKRINEIVPGNKKILKRDRPTCLEIIKVYLANLNIIVNYLHLYAINKNTQLCFEKSSAELLRNNLALSENIDCLRHSSCHLLLVSHC